MTGTDETPVERRLRAALIPPDRDLPPVPEAVTQGAVRRGSRVLRVRRVAVAAVPVLAAVVVTLTVLSVQATAPVARPAQPTLQFSTKEWKQAARDPLPPRTGATLVAVGDEMLVLGGTTAKTCSPTASCISSPGDQLKDGAIYDPAHNRWRRIADAPIGLYRLSTQVVGDEVYVLTRPVDRHSQQFYCYSLATDRWTALPLPPTGIDAIVAVGTERLVGYRVTIGAVDQVYDVSNQVWMPMARDPLAPSQDRNLVATDSGDVVLIAVDPPDRSNRWERWQAAVWNAKSNTWKEFPRSNIVDSDPQWWWAAGRVVNPSTQIVDDGRAAGGTFDPVTGAWGKVPALDSEDFPMLFPPAAGGGRLFYRGQVLDVASGTWTRAPQTPTAVPAEEVSTVIVGDRLMIFGGRSDRPDQDGLINETWVLQLPGS